MTFGVGYVRGLIGGMVAGIVWFSTLCYNAYIHPVDRPWIAFWFFVGGTLGVLLSGGGQFNPAASIISTIRIPWNRRYYLGDLAGGFTGFLLVAILVALFFGIQQWLVSNTCGPALRRLGVDVSHSPNLAHVITPHLGHGGWYPDGIFYEAVAATLLAFVIYHIGRREIPLPLRSLIVGAVIGMGVLMLLNPTGAALNYARYIGAAFLGVLTGHPTELHLWWYYGLATIIIPVLAGLAFSSRD